MPKKTEIYVSKISRRTDPDDLRDFFKKCGKIRNVNVKNGYAFIVIPIMKTCARIINVNRNSMIIRMPKPLLKIWTANPSTARKSLSSLLAKKRTAEAKDLRQKMSATIAAKAVIGKEISFFIVFFPSFLVFVPPAPCPSVSLSQQQSMQF